MSEIFEHSVDRDKQVWPQLERNLGYADVLILSNEKTVVLAVSGLMKIVIPENIPTSETVLLVV